MSGKYCAMKVEEGGVTHANAEVRDNESTINTVTPRLRCITIATASMFLRSGKTRPFLLHACQHNETRSSRATLLRTVLVAVRKSARIFAKGWASVVNTPWSAMLKSVRRAPKNVASVAARAAYPTKLRQLFPWPECRQELGPQATGRSTWSGFSKIIPARRRKEFRSRATFR